MYLSEIFCNRYKTLIFLASLLLTSCGGGGGGSSSPTAVPPPPPPPTYSINGRIYGSNLGSLSAYVDSNFSGKNDNAELTSSVSSTNGSFTLSTTNKNLYDCLVDMPVAAESGSDYFFSYNPNSSSGEVVINPFTSIFSDFIYPTSFWDNPAVDGVNCSTLNNYRTANLRRNTEETLKRIEQYDLLSYSDLTIDPSSPVLNNPIDNTRTNDLQEFWQSIKSIEKEIFDEFVDAMQVAGITGVNMNSRSELDTSNFRIFLNNSTYPNPSTDPSPIANSIDTVAVQAGMDIIGSLDSSAGTWDEVLKVLVHDIHITNNGEMLLDREECWINFSNLCKLEPGIINILTNGKSIIKQLLHKETSRGHEIIEREEEIYDSESLSCDKVDRVNIAEVNNSSFKSHGYSEVRINGFYDISEFECLGDYDPYYSSLWIAESNQDMESLQFKYEQINGWGYPTPNIFSSLPHLDFESIVDDYEQNPVVQIPSEYIEAFLQLNISWEMLDTMNEVIPDMNYATRFVASHGDKNGDYGYFLAYPVADVYYCVMPDIVVGVDGYNDDGMPYLMGHDYDGTSAEVRAYCEQRIALDVDLLNASGDAIRNKSPYRGYLDD